MGTVVSVYAEECIPSLRDESNLRMYCLGQIVSLTGSVMQAVTLSLLVLRLAGTQDPAYWVGLLSALMLLPGILLAPLAGALLDQFDTRRLLMVTGVLGALQASILACLTALDLETIFTINLLVLMMGVVNALDGPSRNAIVKELVHRDNQARASTVFASINTLAQLIGPALAGLLVWSVGYVPAFVLNALSVGALIYSLVRIRLPRARVSPASPRRMLRHLRVGAAYTWSHQGIVCGILLTAAFSTFGFSYTSLLPVITQEMFGGGSTLYSTFAVCGALGSLVAVYVAIWHDRHFSQKMLVVTGILALGMSLLLLSHTRDMGVAMCCFALSGYGFMISFTTLRSSIVHIAEPKKIGAVLGYTCGVFYAGMVLGSWGAGYVANLLGCPAELQLCGVALCILGAVSYYLPGLNALNAQAT